jgi:hypothetical protein
MILSLEVCFIYKKQRSITIASSAETAFLAVTVCGLVEFDAGWGVRRQLVQRALMEKRKDDLLFDGGLFSEVSHVFQLGGRLLLSLLHNGV